MTIGSSSILLDGWPVSPVRTGPDVAAQTPVVPLRVPRPERSRPRLAPSRDWSGRGVRCDPGVACATAWGPCPAPRPRLALVARRDRWPRPVGRRRRLPGVRTRGYHTYAEMVAESSRTRRPPTRTSSRCARSARATRAATSGSPRSPTTSRPTRPSPRSCSTRSTTPASTCPLEQTLAILRWLTDGYGTDSRDHEHRRQPRDLDRLRRSTPTAPSTT